MRELPNRQTIRLPSFNYSSSGYYFVTVCTQNRKYLFGEIQNGKMVLNQYGKIVNNIWDTLPKRFLILLDLFQIMPNHIHFIVNIVGAGLSRPIHYGPRPITKKSTPDKLGQIIAYFKYQSTKQINYLITKKSIQSDFKTTHQTGAETAPLHNKLIFQKIFQRNFYEHIIRNEKEYYAIKKYIQNNPQNPPAAAMRSIAGRLG